jgi:hypothetical protein
VHWLGNFDTDFPILSRHAHDYRDIVLVFIHSIYCGYKCSRFGVSQFLCG